MLAVVECQQGAIEKILTLVKAAMEEWLSQKPSVPTKKQKKYIEENLIQKKYLAEGNEKQAQTTREHQDPELKRKFEQVEKEFQEINKLINIGAGVDKVDFAQAQPQAAEHSEPPKPESKASEHTERQKVRKKQKELKKKLEKIML